MKLDRLVLVLALALASTLGSCGGGSDAPTNANNAFPSEPYVSLTTQAGSYRVEVRTAPVQPLRGDIDVEVRVVDAPAQPSMESRSKSSRGCRRTRTSSSSCRRRGSCG